MNEDEILELNQRAARLGTSRNMLGREYVRQMLATQLDRLHLIAVLNTLGETITELRTDVALGVEAQLLASGQNTEEEIRSWVKAQFKVP